MKEEGEPVLDSYNSSEPARRGVVEQHWCREIHTNSTVPHSSSRMGSANMHFIVH